MLYHPLWVFPVSRDLSFPIFVIDFYF
uniref:Uncharacterized protein n=1 Tax=Rhizophora mucronata TaxID=61149 RepID=A0A2P2NA95_RHIMU